MFCRSAYIPRERHNGTGRSHKDEYRVGVHQIEEQSYRDEQEQEGQGLNPQASKAHANVLIVGVLLVYQLFVEFKSQVDFCPALRRPPLLRYGRMLPGFSSLLGCGIEDLITRRARYLDVTDRAIGVQFEMQRDSPLPALLACCLRIGGRWLVYEARARPTLGHTRLGD